MINDYIIKDKIKWRNKKRFKKTLNLLEGNHKSLKENDLQGKQNKSLIIKRMDKKNPIYAPWSRKEFSKRLSTFWSFPWHSIELPFNAVVCAKNGWICMGQMKIKCQLCKQEMELKTEIKTEIRDELNQVKMGHKENCCWRKKSCDESIMKLPLSDGKRAIEGFNERTKKLDIFKGVPKKLKVPIDMKKDLVKKNTEILSIFGWNGIEIDGIGLLVCGACHRRVGSWYFESEGEEEGFDVVFEHRNYCPWVNSKSQISVEPGWKILYGWLLRLVEPKLLETKESLDVRLQRLREALGLKKT
ncbi:hypothetical protein T552_03383 [Pneumocystis carinii B80]|uniref:C3HC-type domain-containing protein n=1 Tax=Pneumocystis carinii (strain B80) TaxID=1408658 RepID=A0A0W4ZBH3_PNEC8|nr:hypothetical protein T552_03383 [Pneumocystis carinii B80]KTW25770.1 hypothetical protein T552_03383 [Pneumocystis carinii B80]